MEAPQRLEAAHSQRANLPRCSIGQETTKSTPIRKGLSVKMARFLLPCDDDRKNGLSRTEKPKVESRPVTSRKKI